MFWILATILMALAGGIVLLKLKVPGGMLVGAILGVVVLNLTTGQAYIYPQTRIIAQALAGAYIGCMVTKEDLRRMSGIIKPYLVVMGSFFALNMLVSAFIYRVTDFDLLTCLFCGAPGGMTDIPLAALDMGANAPVVTVMMFVRMLFGMAVLPSIILIADRIIEPEHARQIEEQEQQSHRETAEKKKNHTSFRAFLPACFVAFAAGIVGKMTGIPAGTMAFSLAAVIVMKLLGNVPPMPTWMRRAAQVVSGCCIGAGITKEQLMQIPKLALPATVMCLGYIVCCIGMGLVVAKVFRMELREAMLCLSPAGATDMALIAGDLGVHSPNLVVMQIFRLLGVVIFFPQIFNVINQIFG